MKLATNVTLIFSDIYVDQVCVSVRKEHRLQELANMVLRRISGPKREELTGGLRKLHNGELHD
jgi:hypothetical protein